MIAGRGSPDGQPDPSRDSDPPAALGLFGGSFDPVHRGHRRVAELARAACALDRVVFVPCRQSPHKPQSPGASAGQRVAMLRLALADARWAEISTVELHRDGPSFSWMTAEHFADGHSGADLFWILGADQWTALDHWARPDYLAELLTFIVIPRADVVPEPRPGFRMRALADSTPGSSTEVRRRIRAGQPVDNLVAPPVADFIDRYHIYRETDGIH